MPHCFYTGVALRFEDAYIINRRAVRAQLELLQAQVLRLQRLLEQLGPLDPCPNPRHKGRAQVQHRLVCKCMALALSEGIPLPELFETWPTYRKHAGARGKAAQEVRHAST